jgi:hypothetical protein
MIYYFIKRSPKCHRGKRLAFLKSSVTIGNKLGHPEKGNSLAGYSKPLYRKGYTQKLNGFVSRTLDDMTYIASLEF